MSYSVNTNLFKSIFAVPTDIVDKHIRLASGDQLKVLLWILRNNISGFDFTEMCTALKFNPSDAEDYLQYWVLTGVLIKDGDEIAVAPQIPEPKPEPKLTAIKKEIANVEPSRPSNSEIIKRIDESPELGHLFNEIQELVGTVGYNEQSTLLLLHDYYGLPAEVLFMLVDYCVSIGKKNFHYIHTVGKDWGTREIDSVDKAAEVISDLRNANSIWKEFAQFAGITNQKPTARQNDYIRKWSGEFKFKIDMIITAYEEMVERTGKLSLAYMDKILINWHNKGYKKPSDIENEKAEAIKPANKPAEKSSQASYDLDRFKQESLHGELKYERKKKG